MLIGITGTRSPLNESQKDRIQKFLQNYYAHGSELHHGDCVGTKKLGYFLILTMVIHMARVTLERVICGFSEQKKKH